MQTIRFLWDRVNRPLVRLTESFLFDGLLEVPKYGDPAEFAPLPPMYPSTILSGSHQSLHAATREYESRLYGQYESTTFASRSGD